MNHSQNQQKGYVLGLAEAPEQPGVATPRWMDWASPSAGTFPALVTVQAVRDGIAPLAPRRNGLHLAGGSEPLREGAPSGEQLLQMRIALQESQQALAAAEQALAASKAESFRAQQSALHDHTTGLPNRKLFHDRLEQAIAVAERHRWSLAILFVDLDQFKTINDTWGHAAGDLVLHSVATRLMQRTREEDTVCRYGGDEFLFLLMNPKTAADTLRIAEVVVESIAQPIYFGEHQIRVGASIGIAAYPDHGLTGAQLIRNADIAMYQAKTQRSGPVFFE